MSNTVRLIDHNNEMAGVVPTANALALARSVGMDLMEIAAEDDPPVCRIVDLSDIRGDS